MNGGAMQPPSRFTNTPTCRRINPKKIKKLLKVLAVETGIYHIKMPKLLSYVCAKFNLEKESRASWNIATTFQTDTWCSVCQDGLLERERPPPLVSQITLENNLKGTLC